MVVKSGSFTWIFVGCVGLSIALISYYPTTNSFKNNSSDNTEAIDERLSAKIRAIAVKIRVDRKSGSGIIIRQTDRLYTVVTNRHVISGQNHYQIQTSDKQVYPAQLITASSNNDLALLQFQSDRNYPLAELELAPLNLNQTFLATGFPYNSDRSIITSGKLLLQPDKPLKYGYQLGYSNQIQQGMSGGAIFNAAGKVVGINGRSANPILPEYQYQDNTYPERALQQQMRQLSWGIPIIKAIELLGDY